MTQAKEIKQLEEVLKLMTQYRINNVQIGDIKVEKLYHEYPEAQKKNNAKSFDSLTDEELLFMSAK